MNIKHLTPILVGMMLSGGIITSAAAQPTTSSSQNSQVEQLTCIRDPQGLMCNVDDSSNVKSMQRVNIVTKDSSTPSASAVTTEQLAQASDLLLGIIYLGLPKCTSICDRLSRSTRSTAYSISRATRKDLEKTTLLICSDGRVGLDK